MYEKEAARLPPRVPSCEKLLNRVVVLGHAQTRGLHRRMARASNISSLCGKTTTYYSDSLSTQAARGF